jgi:hypothetical protein
MRQDKRPICQDGASHLRAGILCQAVRDYEDALKCRAKGEYARHSIARLEEFFLGEYGQFLSNGHGEDIIRKCRDRVGDHTLRLNIDCRGFTDAQKRRLLEDLTAFIAGRYPEDIVVRGGGHYR